jgi:hypothetical protein
MDLTVRTESQTAEDQSWLGSRHGTDEADPITLDGALMAAVADADGVLKSGIFIAKVTATGRWGPYDSAAVDGRAGSAASPPGFLFTTKTLRQPLLGDASTVTHNVGAALLWHGEVIAAKLPIAASSVGGIDAAGKALTPLIRYV